MEQQVLVEGFDLILQKVHVPISLDGPSGEDVQLPASFRDPTAVITLLDDGSRGIERWLQKIGLTMCVLHSPRFSNLGLCSL